MKKLTALSIIAFNTFIGFSQETINTQAFNKLKISSKIQVELINASEDRIEIVSGNRDDLGFSNTNAVVTLKDNGKTLSKANNYNLKVKVYSSKLNALETENGAYAYGNAIITNDFTINSNLNSKIDLNFDANTVTVNTNSNAEVILNGKIKNLTATAATSSIINAKDLETNESAKLSVTTGGTIEILTNGEVDAQTKAGGTIRVKGNPKSFKEKTNFGGRIIQENKE